MQAGGVDHCTGRQLHALPAVHVAHAEALHRAPHAAALHPRVKGSAASCFFELSVQLSHQAAAGQETVEG